MNKEKVVWSKSKTAKSAVIFSVHFVFLTLITFVLLLWDKVGSLAVEMQERGTDYLYMMFCLLLLVFIAYMYFFFEGRHMLDSGRNIALLFVILDVYIVIAYIIGQTSVYARPVALAALLVFVLVGRREAIFVNVLCALIMFLLDNVTVGETTTREMYSSLMISFTTGMMAIFFCDKAKTRFRIVGVGVLIVIPIGVIIFLLEVSSVIDAKTSGEAVSTIEAWQGLLMQLGYGLFGGVMSAVAFLALLPVFEWLFNCLTVYRLRELTSHDSKLIKKLQQEAPGTFNHSMTVAQLAEACASALGENVDYARAAAYYHDVGKLHQPEYFTENQGEYNLHDELTPELSADIIRMHAQDGYELIRANHLPQFLADVALQHHGTLPIRYFYAKALKMTDGELSMEDFSYVGPKPQSKIAAIIMIADAAEAVVRSLANRTPEAAEKAIRDIIEERMELEQFSECDVTMSDLTIIRQTLVNALTGVYHHRVKYPSIKFHKR
ncbi:MAG: HDIG domain-containing protein [Clostridia bacterium]|nr:HDIG domain-containing protein [Clostridia bacterium]